MKFQVVTHNQPVSICMDISINASEILIMGYDASKENTEFFNRLILKDDKYVFNLPLSPKVLTIVILEAKEGDIPESVKYKINNFKVGNIEKSSLLIDAATKEFIDFAQNFSLKAGYVGQGDYYSSKRNFVIHYMPIIDDNSGTPSRIHKLTGEIDVSKKWFDEMTIPGRMAILMHEFAHNNLNSGLIDENNNDQIEQEADENALEIYIGLGYPRVEWMYAWETIFSDNSHHINRLINSDNKLQEIE